MMTVSCDDSQGKSLDDIERITFKVSSYEAESDFFNNPV